jgi:putative membrane protein
MRNIPTGKAAMALLAAFLGLALPAADAQEPGSRQSREFVQAVMSSDQFEILEAEAALRQSPAPETRAFATRMLEDHRRLAQAVADAATRAGLKPPEMAITADQAQWLSALQSASASEFDRLYFRQQALAHRSALAVEEIYAKSGDEPALRQLASSTVPLISAHADMARQMEAKFGS